MGKYVYIKSELLFIKAKQENESM